MEECLVGPDFNSDLHNGIAYYLHQELKENLPASQYFFDRKDMKIGHEPKENIEPHCRSSFSFIQIIQRESFMHPKDPDEQNWLLNEFEWYSDTFNVHHLIKNFPNVNGNYIFLIENGDTVSSVCRRSVIQDISRYAKWYDLVEKKIHSSLKLVANSTIDILRGENDSELHKRKIIREQHQKLDDMIDTIRTVVKERRLEMIDTLLS